ncbi:MAG: SDR family oxidoreductase [Bdellovibrionia bacterium]
MRSLFITGFPGFLASEFIKKYSTNHAQTLRFHLLVQPKFQEIAKKRAQELESQFSHIKIQLHAGDLTQNFNDFLPNIEPLSDVFHFAAVYDLSTPKEIAYKVNVAGTQNLLNWLGSLKTQPQLHYISTCYVSGKHPGFFTESDLEVDQTFNNFYEETKFHAEVAVQKYLKSQGATKIYRPAIVVGNSTDGATPKYDGPYFILRWLLKQPGVSLLPVIGRIEDIELNVVPRDYIMNSMYYLSQPEVKGERVFQLSDPHPYTVKEILEHMQQAIGQKIVKIPLPLTIAKFSLDYVPGVFQLMEIPSHAVDYFVHPTKYRARDTVEALREANISCPSFDSYIQQLARYVRENPKVPSMPMY